MGIVFLQPRTIIAGLAVATLAAQPLHAAELFARDGLVIRWDNTVRYTSAFRLAGRSSELIAGINTDDGDRNFGVGPVMNRADLMSRLDVSHEGVGVELGADAWYDLAYDGRTDNDSPGSFNPLSVPNDAFTGVTRGLNGRGIELADSFVHADLASFGVPVSFRVGRQTLVWGESLFFAENGIAGAQAPVDQIREALGPGTYGQSAFLPVGQASASLRLPDGLTLEGFYQFEWRATRRPGSGSYLSTNDYYDPGGERWLLRGGRSLLEEPDHSPSGSGGYGAALRFSAWEADFGLYAVRFTSKYSQIYYRLDPAQSPDGRIGTYYRVYPRDIDLYGASASVALGETSLAAEVSARLGGPFESRPQRVTTGSAGGADDPLYAVGDSLHADLSATTNLSRSHLWDSAILQADVAMRWRLGISRNLAALDPEQLKDVAVALRISFEPTYFEVLPHLNLTPRLSLGFGLTGMLGEDPYQSQGEGAGDLTVGLAATYRVVWTGSIGVTHYIGDPSVQSLADRDYLRISLQRTF